MDDVPRDRERRPGEGPGAGRPNNLRASRRPVLKARSPSFAFSKMRSPSMRIRETFRHNKGDGAGNDGSESDDDSDPWGASKAKLEMERKNQEEEQGRTIQRSVSDHVPRKSVNGGEKSRMRFKSIFKAKTWSKLRSNRGGNEKDEEDELESDFRYSDKASTDQDEEEQNDERPKMENRAVSLAQDDFVAYQVKNYKKDKSGRPEMNERVGSIFRYLPSAYRVPAGQAKQKARH